MLDGNNSDEVQQKGIEAAQTVLCINSFLQPGPPFGKRVWDNCALVLAKRNDEDLRPYIAELLWWLYDVNVPGATTIWNRLLQFKDKEWLLYFLQWFLSAEQEDDSIKMWKATLAEFRNIYDGMTDQSGDGSMIE